MIEAYGQLDMTQTPSVGVAGPDTIVKIPDLNVLNVYILPTYFLLLHMAELEKAPDSILGIAGSNPAMLYLF